MAVIFTSRAKRGNNGPFCSPDCSNSDYENSFRLKMLVLKFTPGPSCKMIIWSRNCPFVIFAMKRRRWPPFFIVQNLNSVLSFSVSSPREHWKKYLSASIFAMFDCYRHFSFLHPIQFNTVERSATKSTPLTDVEAIPFPTSSHFQLTAKFNSPASQNDVKSFAKVMSVLAPECCRFQLRSHWVCSCFHLANNTF